MPVVSAMAAMFGAMVGYVLAPPSVHPDGPVYRWGNDVPIATAPDWLVAAHAQAANDFRACARDHAGAAAAQCASPGAYGRAALEYEITALASTPNGQRNHALNRAAFSLFQLVAGGELERSRSSQPADRSVVRQRADDRSERWAGQCQAHHRKRPPCRNPAPAVPIMTGAPELWPFQHDIIAEFDRCVAAGDRRIMLVAPTGSGKTVIGGGIINKFAAVRKFVLVLAHRREIITQTSRKLRNIAIPHGIIMAGTPSRPLENVQVAAIQTLHRRAIGAEIMELPPADLLVIDEAHHCPATTYKKIIDAYPDAILLGLTATPCRGDGRGLGGIFESMIECPQVAELIAADIWSRRASMRRSIPISRACAPSPAITTKVNSPTAWIGPS